MLGIYYLLFPFVHTYIYIYIRDERPGKYCWISACHDSLRAHPRWPIMLSQRVRLVALGTSSIEPEYWNIDVTTLSAMVIYKIALLCRDVLNCRIVERSWNGYFQFSIQRETFTARCYASRKKDRGTRCINYLVPIDSTR